MENLKIFLERVAGVSFDPLITNIRATISMIVQDPELKAYFDEYLNEIRRNLTEAGYARSGAAAQKRRDLGVQWKSLLEKDNRWKTIVNRLKEQLSRVEEGLTNDEDLKHVKAAHQRFNKDIEQGLIDASTQAQTGLQAAMEQVTWFWQDLFKVYMPRIMSKMKDLPIPRYVAILHRLLSSIY